MTKNKTIIIATIIMTVAAILVGCNQSEKVSEISTTQNTTLEAATVQITNQASVEATVNSTTTAIESTTMKKTNQKEKESSTATVTTTQKSKVSNTTTTTKKVTTTEKPYFCDEGGTHHSCEAGIGGWVNTYEQAQNNGLEYIAAHNTSGNFEVQQCLQCGKYTVYVRLD